MVSYERRLRDHARAELLCRQLVEAQRHSVADVSRSVADVLPVGVHCMVSCHSNLVQTQPVLVQIPPFLVQTLVHQLKNVLMNHVAIGKPRENAT